MVEEQAVDRAVAPLREVATKAVAIQAAQAGLAAKDAAHEVHLAVVGKQIDDLVVQTLVEVVAIRELHLADRVHILECVQMRGQPFDLGPQ